MTERNNSTTGKRKGELSINLRSKKKSRKSKSIGKEVTTQEEIGSLWLNLPIDLYIEICRYFLWFEKVSLTPLAILMQLHFATLDKFAPSLTRFRTLIFYGGCYVERYVLGIYCNKILFSSLWQLLCLWHQKEAERILLPGSKLIAFFLEFVALNVAQEALTNAIIQHDYWELFCVHGANPLTNIVILTSVHRCKVSFTAVIPRTVVTSSYWIPREELRMARRVTIPSMQGNSITLILVLLFLWRCLHEDIPQIGHIDLE